MNSQEARAGAVRAAGVATGRVAMLRGRLRLQWRGERDWAFYRRGFRRPRWRLDAPLACFAFSLVELLIVIAIIAILAAVALPVFNRAQEDSRATACISNLHQIGVALQIYVDANNNTLPIMRDAPMDANELATNTFPTVNLVLGGELGNTNVLRCPSDFQGIFQLTGSSYSWNNLLNGENANHLVVMGMNFKPRAIPVFFDKQGFHAARGPNKAVNYLYADGHIKNLLTIEGALPQ